MCDISAFNAQPFFQYSVKSLASEMNSENFRCGRHIIMDDLKKRLKQ